MAPPSATWPASGELANNKLPGQRLRATPQLHLPPLNRALHRLHGNQGVAIKADNNGSQVTSPIPRRRSPAVR